MSSTKDRTICFRLLKKGFIVAFMLLAMSPLCNLQPIMAATSIPASTYNCYPTHCYGIADWSDNQKYPAINGAATDILVVHLSCPSPACSYNNADFIDTEIWIRDVKHQASSCPTYKVGCWIEGGVIAFPNSGSGTTGTYFWADYRPGDKTLNYHGLQTVPSADYGGVVSIFGYRTVNSNCSTSPRTGTFELDFVSNTLYLPELSQRNCMTPDDINIGEELQGTSGASAPTAHYTYNVWEGTDNNTHYQTMNADTGTPNAPVQDKWFVLPSQSSTGGDFGTWCTC